MFTHKVCGFALFRRRASITIEAALCIPLMASALVMLIMPLKIFEERRKLQNMLELEAEKISNAAYISSLSKEFINPETDIEEYRDEIDVLKASAVKADVLGKMNKDIFDNIRFGDSTTILEDSDKAMIRIHMNYEIKAAANFLGLNRIKMSSVVNRRAYIGSEGGRGREKYLGKEENGTDKEDRLVYVGRNRSRYHLDRKCHYISNDIKAIDMEELKAITNNSGSHYKPCSACKPDKTGIVYYFENGTSYHRDKSCRSLNSYVEAVPLSEVIHLGACSYCGS
ncbi:MAG: hypothetical protein Q4B86_00410 [Eubacteriales bacterium]|nr:hypothetical protein [Eubacteriales bacterium]